jgi:hypothetical protein
VDVALAAGTASGAFRGALAGLRPKQLTYLGLRTAIVALNRQLRDATSYYNKTHLSPPQEPTAPERAAFDRLARGFGALPPFVDQMIESSVRAITVQDDPNLKPNQDAVVAALGLQMKPAYEDALSPTTYPLAPLADAATAAPAARESRRGRRRQATSLRHRRRRTQPDRAVDDGDADAARQSLDASQGLQASESATRLPVQHIERRRRQHPGSRVRRHETGTLGSVGHASLALRCVPDRSRRHRALHPAAG